LFFHPNRKYGARKRSLQIDSPAAVKKSSGLLNLSAKNVVALRAISASAKTIAWRHVKRSFPLITISPWPLSKSPWSPLVPKSSCGIRSRNWWLTADNGSDSHGYGILYAIARPVKTCGVSNIVSRLYSIRGRFSKFRDRIPHVQVKTGSDRGRGKVFTQVLLQSHIVLIMFGKTHMGYRTTFK